MRREYWVGLLLMGVYLVLTLTTTQLLHFSRALDEGYHLELVTFIKENGRIPTTFEERTQMARADLPLLYHILVALIPPSLEGDENDQPKFKYYHDSFRYRVIDHQIRHPWTVDTEDLSWPYYGQFRVWQVGRWLSVIFSAGTILVIFLILQEIPLGNRPLTSLFGAALLAFIPRYLILGAALNDDSLLGLISALYFWMLVKMVKAPTRWLPMILLGATLGITLTIKYSLALMPFEIIVVLGVIAWRQELGWGWFFKRLLTIGLITLLFSSWWFGWNFWFFNTISEEGLLVGTIRSLFGGGYNVTLNRIGGILSGGEVGLSGPPVETQNETLGRWAYVTFLSLWGYNINGQIPFRSFIYVVVTLLIIAAIGNWRMWQRAPQSHQWLLLTVFHLLLLLVIPLLRFETSHRIGQTAQGRHILIPAAAAIVALITWGLATIVSKKWHKSFFSAIIAGFIVWSGAHLYQLNLGAVPLLSMRTIARAAEWLPFSANSTFGKAIELASYDIELRPEQGALHLDLAWRSLAYVNENYLLNIKLVDSKGQIVSHWTGYNGQGRLPTLAWDPGDVVFDRLTLPLPNLPTGDYTVQIEILSNTGLLPVEDYGTGEVANLKSSSAPEPGTMLQLATVSLERPAKLYLSRNVNIPVEEQTNPVRVDYDLWESTGPVNLNHLPVYRYPATISIITSSRDIDLMLVGPGGQAWPATRAQANIYTFVIGPRWSSGDYRLQVILHKEGQVIGQVTTGPVLTVENWWERRFEIPEIPVPVRANFANQIQLLGYKLPQKQVKAGQAFPITLYWRAPAEMAPQADFIQFNHLFNDQGMLQGGYDRRPLEYYSTLLWAPGEVVVDGYAVPVDADAPPGEYYLDVGFYLTVGESAVNLPLVVDGQMTDVTSITLGPVEVVAP